MKLNKYISLNLFSFCTYISILLVLFSYFQVENNFIYITIETFSGIYFLLQLIEIFFLLLFICEIFIRKFYPKKLKKVNLYPGILKNIYLILFYFGFILAILNVYIAFLFIFFMVSNSYNLL